MSEKTSKGRPSSAGKRKGKFERYFANTAARKLRHVLKHNGPAALAAYKTWVFSVKVMKVANEQLVLPKEAEGR